MNNILVFGIGNYYEKKKKSLTEAYNIIAFIDNKKSGIIDNVPIITPSEIIKFDYDYIIIMSGAAFVQMTNQLIDLGVEVNKILYGLNFDPYLSAEEHLFGENGRIFINEDKEICYITKGEPKVEIAIRTMEEFFGVREIFGGKIYGYNINYSNGEVVIDIGLNIGDSALYFAMQDKVTNVYGFEPFKETFKQAQRNIKRNKNISEKIKIYQYGMGKEDKKIEITYNPNMSCGMSTDVTSNEHAICNYLEWGLIDTEKSKISNVEIKNVSNIVKSIMDNHLKECYILKMDCEGAEYEIIQKLSDSMHLSKFSIIMLEWHYSGSKLIEDLLVKNGFSYFIFNKVKGMGVIYAYNK